MEDAIRDPSTASPMRSPLVDVSDLPLTVVMTLNESVLGNALRRLRTEAGDDTGAVAGWASQVDE